MLLELAPRISRLILTQADHPRAEGPEGLADLARAFGQQVEVTIPVSEAVRIATRQAGDDEVVLVTGSIFVVGSALAAWDAEQAQFVAAEPVSR